MARDTVMMTVRGGSDPPSLEAAAAQLGADVGALNADFGVNLIDPGRGLYAVEVYADSLPAGAAGRSPFRGPYSNPRIEGFGPPSEDEG